MDVVVVQVRRSETTVCVDLLNLPGVTMSTVRLPDSQPDLALMVHVSDRSLLFEYYKGKTSLRRVLFRRGNLQIAATSSNPQPFNPQCVYDKHSPFRLFGRLTIENQASYPEFLAYNEQLYRLQHYSSSLRTTLHLSILSLDRVEKERFSTDFLPDPSLVHPCPREGRSQLYGTYVTQWYVLVFGLEEVVGVWRYRAGGVEVVRIGQIRLKAWVAQRSCGDRAYFLDTAKRVVILTSDTLRVFNMLLYQSLLPILYLHLHKRLPLPKPLLRDLCLVYLS